MKDGRWWDVLIGQLDYSDSNLLVACLGIENGAGWTLVDTKVDKRK